MPNEIKLTIDQQQAIKSLWTGLKDGTKEQQSLGGFAGTGKTTVISYMINKLPNTAVCAFTGKAASVLRRKGVEASTIHSLIYEPYFNGTQIIFELRGSLPGFDRIIVDEASMVPTELYHDLMSFKLPVLFVGDHGQLEPVGTDFNLMKNPDFKLEKIHRNAGDIAKFAERLRFNQSAKTYRGKEGKVIILDRNFYRSSSFIDLACDSDQVICAYNKTRVEINERVRSALGREGLVTVGEKVMCLKNNNKLGIYNGQQGIVTAYYRKGKSHFIDFESYGIVYRHIQIMPSQFGQEKTAEKIPEGQNPFDYAYAITCHKSQGDQFSRILVVEQICKNWEHKRWAYTAASRAEDMVYWLAA